MLPDPPIKKKKISLEPKKIFFVAFKAVIFIFAVAGFGLISSYVAVCLHLTNEKGVVDKQSDVFWQDSKIAAALSLPSSQSADDIFFNKKNYCSLSAIKSQYPADFMRILDLAFNDKKDLAQKNLDAVIITLSLPCEPDTELPSVTKQDFEQLAGAVNSQSPFVWANSEEWDFFKQAVLKDKDVLAKIESQTGIKSRILVSQLMAEQMRLFYSDRPWFKKAVEPLKVLGSMTQFSWGIFGIKSETASTIENNLKSPQSSFYLGAESQNLLDFSTANPTQERFDRLTNSGDHYYSYLYAALLNKEIMAQWQKAGYDISNRPEILATLFNIGFDHSKPGPNPQVGGADLNIAGQDYSFGRLAFEFYYSSELLDDFPQ